MAIEQHQAERWWRARARRAVLRVNMGWWLDGFLPSVLGVSVVTAVAMLGARRGGGEVSWLLGGYVCALVLAALGAWWIARRRFESGRDGLVRIEAELGLKNRLTASAAGIGEWPPVRTAARDGLAWNWRRSMWHPVVSALLLAAAGWIPVTPEPAAGRAPLEEPLAWSEIEDWVDTLEEESIVEEEGLRKLREQVDQLRAQPMEEWYSHSSLEAGDSLKQQTEQSIRELERDLQGTMMALAALESLPDSTMPAGMQESWKKFMDEALKGLDGSMLPIDPELLSRLEEIDPRQLRTLTPEELAALKEALENGLQACNQCTGEGTNLVAMVTSAQMWGSGGIDRGPGEAPMTLNPRQTRLDTTRRETLQNADLSRAALGDTLAVGETEHEIDESLYRGPQTAGTVASQGEGGDAVWRAPLDPDEQEVVKRYFQ